MTLADISEAITDCEHKTAPIQASGIPSIRTTDIKNGRLLLHQANRVSEETYKEWTARLEPRPGDLLMAREAPVGGVGIVPEGARICLGQRTVLVRPNQSKVVPRFLLYLLLTPEMQHLMISRAEGSITPHLNMSDIRALAIPELPDIKEQQAVAEFLGALDDKIELNRCMNETLEEISRAIFKSWFVDFDPVHAKAEEHSSVRLSPEIAQLFPTRLDLTTGLPVGWKSPELTDVCTTQYGYTASAADAAVGPKFLRVMDINKADWIDWNSVPQCKIDENEFDHYRLRYGDIVVARMADPGKSALIVDEVPAVFASYLVRLKTASLAQSFYVYGFLKSELYREYAEGARSGSVQSNMNARVIVGTSIVWPSEEVLDAFLRMMEPIRKKIALNVRESTTLNSIRDSLLPKLVSGEIRLKDAGKIVEAHA